MSSCHLAGKIKTLCGGRKLAKQHCGEWKCSSLPFFFLVHSFSVVCLCAPGSPCLSSQPQWAHIKHRSLRNRSFCTLCIVDLCWPPCRCFHRFPRANVLSSEAVILCELACGGDCLVVAIHHLFGRGDCMSDWASGYWYDVRSEHLVQGG